MRFDLERLLTPSAWLQTGKTDWAWDAELNEYLDTNPPFITNVFSVRFPDYTLWVDNYPYWYGSKLLNVYKLPSVKTRKRLRAYIS